MPVDVLLPDPASNFSTCQRNAACQEAPVAEISPLMVTTSMGQLARAVDALCAPSHVRPQRLHCQWSSTRVSWWHPCASEVPAASRLHVSVRKEGQRLQPLIERPQLVQEARRFVREASPMPAGRGPR